MEKYIGIDKNIMVLDQIVKVCCDTKIDEELFLFTDIQGKNCTAKGNLLLKKKEDGVFLQDTFEHEQCLVITAEGKKILMSGCAHTGILNILDRYSEICGGYPDLVISGFHLIQNDPYSEAEKEKIEDLARKLLKTGAMFYSGHCTGQAAVDIMKKNMGDRLEQIHSGNVIL